MCRKVKFTKKEAETFLKHIDHANQCRREKRAYYCEYCNAWHLTSQEERVEILDIKPIYEDKWKKLLTLS